jgi:hypothetical protein
VFHHVDIQVGTAYKMKIVAVAFFQKEVGEAAFAPAYINDVGVERKPESIDEVK